MFPLSNYPFEGLNHNTVEPETPAQYKPQADPLSVCEPSVQSRVSTTKGYNEKLQID